MAHRFFVESLVQSPQIAITGAEAHHLQHVMRARVSDRIVLFDGSGKEFSAEIVRIDRDRVAVQVLKTTPVDRELPHRLVLGVALPKGDRQRWLIEKVVELGVTAVVPIRTARSVVHPDQRASKKLLRAVVEASKQCGRNRLMELAPSETFDEFIRTAPQGANCWLADPSGEMQNFSNEAGQETYLAVGPEGGFSPEELSAASSAGWQIVSLGRRILRIETACVVLAARTTAYRNS